MYWDFIFAPLLAITLASSIAAVARKIKVERALLLLPVVLYLIVDLTENTIWLSRGMHSTPEITTLKFALFGISLVVLFGLLIMRSNSKNAS